MASNESGIQLYVSGVFEEEPCLDFELSRCAASSFGPRQHDTAAYLTRDMLPERLSRFADYVTAAWQDRRTIINEHSTSLDIDNKLAYLYNYYVEHDKTHEMLPVRSVRTASTGPSPSGKKQVPARAKKCATSLKSMASTLAKDRDGSFSPSCMLLTVRSGKYVAVSTKKEQKSHHHFSWR
ncbi:hypothetical protein E4U51_001415 [Claviceps purpurea]|nr:hypothetical protein E4U51_001415 [Claviceps purpurea]